MLKDDCLQVKVIRVLGYPFNYHSYIARELKKRKIYYQLKIKEFIALGYLSITGTQ